MKKLSEHILSWLLNIPTILTVCFGASIVYKNQQTPLDVATLLAWVIGLISLMATSMLIERFASLRKIEKNVIETNKFLKLREGLPSLDAIIKCRKDLEPLEDRLKHAKDIRITGGSLFRLSSEYIGFFEEKAKDGCKIKFLVLNPECLAAKLIAENIVYEADSIEVYKSHIKTALKNLKSLQLKFPDQILIKTSECVPSFGLLICDPDKTFGNIMVEFYTLAVPTRQRPHIILQKPREPQWFSFYFDQFNRIWEASGNVIIDNSIIEEPRHLN